MTTHQPKLKLIDKPLGQTPLASPATYAVATRSSHTASATNLTILQKLRILNTPPAPQLFGTHPLADRGLDFRLQYLAAVTMLIAVEREPTPAEQRSFIDLGTALGVDMAEAQEQLSERASLSVDDIALLLAAVRAEKAAWPYLLDLAWIHASKGDFDANTLAATREISTLLATHLDAARMAGRFVLTLRQRSRAIFEELPKVFDLEQVRPYLPALLASFFPFSNLVDHRWINHGNGFVTDCTCGVMWSRFFVGQRWENARAVGEPRTYGTFDADDNPQFSADFSWERELNEINFNFQLGGFGDWRFFDFENDLTKLTFKYYCSSSTTDKESFFLHATNANIYYWCKPIETNGIIFDFSKSNYFSILVKADDKYIVVNIGKEYTSFSASFSARKLLLVLCRDALPTSPPPAMTSGNAALRDEMIAQAAYFYAELDGFNRENCIANWLRAEADVTARHGSQ